MNNGDGLRVVLWLSGCSHHCYNCQNPQTWNPESGIPFDEEAENELFRELDKDYIYQESHLQVVIHSTKTIWMMF